MSDTARDQANAQMESVRQLVAALECDFDRLSDLREARQELVDALDGDSQEDVNALEAWDAENSEELAELEAQAGDVCEREEAENRIREDALSVEVRSGWATLDSYTSTSLEPEEFRIVLCTGGPHVEILGELDDNGEPSRAWLAYRGWGESGERVNQEGDQAALLAYAACFYFGE